MRVQKTASYTRWDRRPLDAEQLAYAREDVLHLLELATELERRLARQRAGSSGRARSAGPSSGVSDTRDLDTVFARLPRINSLRRRRARDRARARRAGARRSPSARTGRSSTVLNDAALVELAKRAPRTPEQLDQIRGVNPGSLRRRGAELLAAIARGRRRSRRSRSRPSATSRTRRSTARRSRSARRSSAPGPSRPGWPTS